MQTFLHPWDKHVQAHKYENAASHHTYTQIVEEALLPLRLKAYGLVVRKVDWVLKKMDAALQHVDQEQSQSYQALRPGQCILVTQGWSLSFLQALQSHLVKMVTSCPAKSSSVFVMQGCA